MSVADGTSGALFVLPIFFKADATGREERGIVNSRRSCFPFRYGRLWGRGVFVCRRGGSVARRYVVGSLLVLPIFLKADAAGSGDRGIVNSRRSCFPFRYGRLRGRGVLVCRRGGSVADGTSWVHCLCFPFF